MQVFSRAEVPPQVHSILDNIIWLPQVKYSSIVEVLSCTQPEANQMLLVQHAEHLW